MTSQQTTSGTDGKTAHGNAAGIFVQQCHCLSAFGDETASAAALNEGSSALRLTPVLGNGTASAPVPLALISAMDTSLLLPRWWPLLCALTAPLAGQGWGTAQRPIYLTGSNYGVDSLYAAQHDRDRRHTPWGTPHGIASQLRQAMGWGENITIFSHACVSAQLGLLQAQRTLELGLADEVLIVSFDFLSPFVTGGFHSLKILNGHLPQPYYRRETGSIGLGDGAAWAVLSRQPSPWRIAAQSTFNEMYHFTGNDPSGNGFAAVLEPLAKAADGRRLWVKGHGTGTLEAGELEATACAAAFGAQTPLVSWKGGLGHTLGSCALVELAITMAARRSGSIPASTVCGEPQGQPFTSAVAQSPLSAGDFDATILLSNAFGGAHAGMLLCYEQGA